MRMRRYKRERKNAAVSFYASQIVTSLHNSGKASERDLSKIPQPRHYLISTSHILLFYVFWFIFLGLSFICPLLYVTVMGNSKVYLYFYNLLASEKILSVMEFSV